MVKVLLTGIALFMLTATNAQAQNISKTIGNITAVKNSEVKIPVVLKNINPTEIKNITLTIDIAGEEQQVEVTPEMIINNDGTSMFYVTAEAPTTTGMADMNITIDAINGKKMNDVDVTTSSNIMTVSRNVEHKVLIEKYTAMWCPTCPTGIVGIERTKMNYGDKVIVLESHSQDPLTSKDYKDLDNLHRNLPRATVDRDPVIGDVNPYLGSERQSNEAKYGLGYDIEEQMAIAPVVELKIGGGIVDKEITVKANITTLYTGDANLGVSYIVTQDGLSNPNWKQQNSLPIYYRDHEVIQIEPLWEPWFNGEVEVPGVVYDDVIRCASEPLKGHMDVIPSQVEEEKTYTGEHVFDMSKYKKIKEYDNMNLCVIVIDNNTGKIVNSAIVKLSEANAIDDVASDNVTEVARYSIDGQRITTPAKGINIVKFSDGSVRKVMIK